MRKKRPLKELVRNAIELVKLQSNRYGSDAPYRLRAVIKAGTNNCMPLHVQPQASAEMVHLVLLCMQ
jgi:hypothetical protein